MKNKRFPVMITGAVLLGLSAALTWLWFGQSEQNGQSRNSVQAPSVAEPEHRAFPGSPEAPISSTPLPPLDETLPSIFGELKRRAANRDPAATCRLAAEYADCGQLQLQRADAGRWLADRRRALDLIADAAVKQQAVAHIEREMSLRNGRLDALATHCGDIHVPAPAEIAKIWRDAALLGNPAAMRQYASGNAFSWNNIIDMLPLLNAYKGEAEAMSTRLARRGDINAILSLAAGYNPTVIDGRSMLAQTLKPDAARSLALYERAKRAIDVDRTGKYRVLMRDLDAAIEELKTGMPQDQLVDAARLSKEMFASWSAPAMDNAPERISIAGRQIGITRADCDPSGVPVENAER